MTGFSTRAILERRKRIGKKQHNQTLDEAIQPSDGQSEKKWSKEKIHFDKLLI